MKIKNVSQYAGFVLGILYGIAFRLLSDMDHLSGLYDLFSITFIWIIPTLIGLFPILFSSNKLYLSPLKLFLYPIISVFLFLITTYLTGLEDVFCLFIMGIPCFIAAGVLGILLGAFLKDKIVNKKIYSIFLLPLILSPVENIFPNKSQVFKETHSVIIHKSASAIFPNLLEVQPINTIVYGNGFFQTVGIPTPINSKIFSKDSLLYRIGYFTDDLKLYESVEELKENHFVSFQVHLDKSELRDKPTDLHIMKSDYFKFGKISYELIPINNTTTKVVLSCEYTINSKMNFYANFWAKNIIADFEKRLLKSIKNNLEA
ncbi:hypothetical protein [Paenimyroides aestuarii]|uniref:Uncharacterized protein n=1 Tax=Paenimyroides aestuarii TaxID=2968490 RepID=A0ABY5NW57_9FLAO|nr:hypothetical protein [Paenimyroides aestuarii]UUV22693.1 hypothetical protein NPX36_06540 [Paenimyroides aestuarii]